MPIEKERKKVLKTLYAKLTGDCYLLWMSRSDLTGVSENQRVNDGYYRYPDRLYHSFITKFETEDIHEMMRKIKWPWKGYKHIKSLRIKGEDQTFMYSKYGSWPKKKKIQYRTNNTMGKRKGI